MSQTTTDAEWLDTLQRVQAIARTVNSNLELDTILRTIVETVCRHGWQAAMIAILDEQQQEVSFVAVHGTGPAPAMGTWPVAASLTPRVVRAGRYLTIDDAWQLDEYPAVQQSARTDGYRSLIIAPLGVEGETAALWLCSQEQRCFSARELAFAAAIADQAGLAIRNARLYHRERQTVQTLERIISFHKQLTQMVLAGRGLPSMAQTVAALLGNPVLVEDRLGRPLASSQPGVAAKGAGPPQPAAEPVPPPLPERPTLTSRRGADGLVYTCVCTGIVAGQEPLGRLTLWQTRRAVDEVDLLLVEQVAQALALELMKERIRLQVELRLTSDFVGELISGRYPSQEELLRRAAMLGVDLGRPVRLIVTLLFLGEAGRPQGRHMLLSRPEVVEQIASRVGRRYPGALVVSHADHLVLLAPEAIDARELVRSVTQEVHSSHPNVQVANGTGRVCTAPEDYRPAYQEALQAAEAAGPLGLLDELVSIDKLGAYGLLLRGNDPEQLRAFVRRQLGELIPYGEKHGSTLLDTLDTYLRCNCNLRDTARRLYVHVSTMRYRLERIAAITGLDLENPDARFNVEMALRIHRWAVK